MTPAALAARLRQMAGEATNSPWRVNTKDHAGEDWMIGVVMDCGTGENKSGRYSDYIVSTDRISGLSLNPNRKGAEGDAKLIVELRNNLDTIVRALEALDGAEKALKWIADHATTDEGDVEENAEAHGLDAQEFLEMAHDNLVNRARSAIRAAKDARP